MHVVHAALARRWLALIGLSLALASLLSWIQVPGGLLLGPLVVAAAMAARGRAVAVPASAFRIAHAVIGLLIARTLALGMLAELLHDWPIFLAGVVSVLLASTGIGWALARWRVLPGTTAVWGAAPGGASAMIILAGSFGADMRLVAFMQYLRVLTAILAATLVAHVWVGDAASPVTRPGWFAPVDPGSLAATLLLVVASLLLARRLRLPAGTLLVPMLLGTVLNNAGVIAITLPPWLLAPAYAVVGWQVGARFDKPILLHAARALPGVLAGTAALIGVCAGFAALLVTFAGIDTLTAYLATSPGGIDSVAIIGLAGNADMAFVMAMQIARLLIVLLTGPWIARLVARSVER